MSGKQWFIIAIITLITAISWAVFNILHSQAAVKTPPQIEKLLEPISPNFDQDVINSL